MTDPGLFDPEGPDESFLSWLFPKRPQPGPVGVRQALAAFRERERNRAENKAAGDLVRPDVTAVHRGASPLIEGRSITARQPDNTADRIAQQQADELFAEAEKRKKLFQGGPHSGTWHRFVGPAYATGRTTAELAAAVPSLLGRDVRGVSEPLRREAELTDERLIKPGEGAPSTNAEQIGAFVGSLPPFAIGEAIAGPVTRALSRRLVQRGAGQLASMGGRTLFRGAEGLAAISGELSIGSGIQGTAAGLGRGESPGQALQSGLESGIHSLDPRHPIQALILAKGAFGGAVHGANEHMTYRERLGAVREARSMREAGFGPIMPEEAQQVRTAEEARAREARRAASAKPPSGEPVPYREPHLPEGAPRVAGGTEAELEARRPRRGEPGVLGSGPVLGEGAATLGAAGLGAAAGVAQAHGGSTEDKLLGALLGATIGSGFRESLRGARGRLHSAPLVGGPEAAFGPGAPFFSRLGRELQNLPERGASPQRLEALHREGRYSKNEYDFVLGHQLEGREPGRDIPKAELMQLYDRQALRLRATEMPRAADPAMVERYQQVSTELAGHRNAIVEHRAAIERQLGDVLPVRESPPAADFFRNEVHRRIQDPQEAAVKVERYERIADYHGATVSWTRAPEQGARLLVTVKRPGRPPIRLRSRSPYWDVSGVLADKNYQPLADYLNHYDWRSVGTEPNTSEAGKVRVNMPPIDPAKKAALLQEAQRLQGEHATTLENFRRLNDEQDRLEPRIHGEQTHFGGYGPSADAAGVPEPNSYREWLLSLDRPAPLELPHNWVTRQREGGAYEVRNTGGNVIGTGDTRGSAVWDALQRSGDKDLMRRFHAGHWGTVTPDQLFHVRADVRTGYNTETNQPERLLFIREIQSDYFQGGQPNSAGYQGMYDQRTNKLVAWPRGPSTPNPTIALRSDVPPEGNSHLHPEIPDEALNVLAPDPATGNTVLYTRAKAGEPWEIVRAEDRSPVPVDGMTQSPWQVVRNGIAHFSQSGKLVVYAGGDTPGAAEQAAMASVRKSGAPAAPWRKTEDWTKLAVRHIVQKAVEQNLRHIVWTPGALNSWAAGHGFKDFYDKIIPRVFRDVGKELGVEMSFEPAPLTRTKVDWKIEPVEEDALTPERVASAWKQVTSVEPWVIQRSKTMRQLVGALDQLFRASGEQYQPTIPGDEGSPTVTGTRLMAVIDEMMDNDFPSNGLHIQRAVTGHGLGEAPRVNEGTLRQALLHSGANSTSVRHLMYELGFGADRNLPAARVMGAQSHGPADVWEPETVSAEVQRMLKNRFLTDQTKVALLNLLGVRRAESYQYGPQFHSVRLPEHLDTSKGFRMYGGIPFDPEWFKAVGLPAAGAAIGAGVGIATKKDDEGLGGALLRGAVGAAVGAVGGLGISRALKARQLGRTGAAAVQPVPPAAEPAGPGRRDFIRTSMGVISSLVLPGLRRLGEAPKVPGVPMVHIPAWKYFKAQDIPATLESLKGFHVRDPKTGTYLNSWPGEDFLAKFPAEVVNQYRQWRAALGFGSTIHPTEAAEPPGDVVKPEATPVPEGEASPGGVAARPGGRPDVEPPVNPADYVNFAKLDLDPTGATRLEAEVERVVLDRGIHPKQVVSHNEVRAAADELGLDINAGDINRRISGARLLAIRNILSANIAAQERWAGELADATIPAERRAQLLRLSGVLDTQNRNLLEQFVRARSAAGRELNALKIVAKRTLDPSVWWAKARQFAARDLTADELVNIRRLVEERDRAGLVSYVGRLRTSTVSEQLLTLWKAGLLTNPKTHVVNLTSNTVMAGLETAKDPVAAGADWLLSLWTGQRTKGGINRHLASASWRALRTGTTEAGEALRGRVVGDELERGVFPRETTIDLPGLSPGANALLDGYQRYVFRLLGASDRVFFNVALQRSLVEQAGLAGRRMGLRGVQLRQYVEGIQRGEGALADQISAQALKDAAVATFRDQTRLGKAAQAFAREFPGGQVILPFQRTPGAVATRVIEYSPLGLGKGVVDAIRLAFKGKDAPPQLQRMVAEELGRGATGSGLVYVGYWLAQNGYMTGAAPTLGSTERQQWRQERRPANALNVRGQWVEVGRLSPVGNLLSLGASLHDRLEAKHANLLSPEGIAETGFAGLRTVADQPFVTGVTAFGEALMQPDQELNRFVQGTAASVVPAAIGAVARGTDVARTREFEPAGPLSRVAGAVMERVPGLRQQLPPARDSFGKTIPSVGLINAMFNPAQATPDIRRTDPVVRELAEAKYAVPRLPRQKGEGAIVFERRQRVFGAYTRAAIAQLINSAEYGAAKELEQQIEEQARALVNDPRFAGRDPEAIREALMAQATAERGAHTRAELLHREVSRVRAQLRKALAPSR